MATTAQRRRWVKRVGPVVWAQAATHARSPLSWRARCIALALAFHAEPDSMSSRAGIAQLVAWTGLSDATCKRGRRELIATGFVLLARAHTPLGDEDAAVHLLRIPASASVDNPEGVGSDRPQGGFPQTPPQRSAEHGGGVSQTPHEERKESPKATEQAPAVDNGCALGPSACAFCRRGLTHPP